MGEASLRRGGALVGLIVVIRCDRATWQRLATGFTDTFRVPQRPRSSFVLRRRPSARKYERDSIYVRGGWHSVETRTTVSTGRRTFTRNETDKGGAHTNHESKHNPHASGVHLTSASHGWADERHAGGDCDLQGRRRVLLHIRLLEAVGGSLRIRKRERVVVAPEVPRQHRRVRSVRHREHTRRRHEHLSVCSEVIGADANTVGVGEEWGEGHGGRVSVNRILQSMQAIVETKSIEFSPGRAR